MKRRYPLLFFGLLCLSPWIRADVTFDGSLRAETQGLVLQGPNVSIRADYGQQHGANLFHSFQQFGVNEGQVVTFTDEGALGSIANVIGRVTGNDATAIDGTLAMSIANANLYLINPNGIMLGEHAKLDLPGSFYASTADYLKFSDGELFHADPASASVLSVSEPAAFGFLQDGSPPKDIVVGTRAGNPHDVNLTLNMREQTAFALAAGNIEIDNADILATGGDIQITAMDNGEVKITSADLADSKENGGNVTLFNTTLSTTVPNTPNFFGGSPGSVAVAGRDVVLEGSALSSSTYGPASSGEIRVTADKLTLAESPDIPSRIETNVNSPALFGGSNIVIDTGDLSVSGGSQIRTLTRAGAIGSSGKISIDASRSVYLSGLSSNGKAASGIFSTAEKDSFGQGGAIALSSPALLIENGAQISADTQGYKNGGSVDISVGDAVLRGVAAGTDGAVASGISVSSDSDSTSASAGNLDLTARNLSLEDGAQINAATGGRADAGSLAIHAAQIRLAGTHWVGTREIASGFYAAALPGSSGAGGTIDLGFQGLSVSAGAQINSSALGAGSGGNIYLNCPAGACLSDASHLADDILPISLLSATLASMNRSYGATADLNLSSHAAIAALTGGSQRAGTIVGVLDSLSMSDSALMSVSSLTDQPGGAVLLSLNNLDLLSRARIESMNSGSGPAGSIGIAGADSLLAREGSGVSVATHSGDAGDMFLSFKSLLYLDGSYLTTSAANGTGNGGNILIDPVFTVLNDGRIVANAWAGHGGNITIATDFLLSSQDSTISASSALGVNGMVNILSPYSNIAKSLEVLPYKMLSRDNLLSEDCSAANRGSTFIQTGRGGLPLSPESGMASSLRGLADCGSVDAPVED